MSENVSAPAPAAPGLTVRDARPEDGVPIRRLVFDILCEYGLPADPDGSDADVMVFGTPAPGVVHLVAEMEGRQVGSAILTPSGDGKTKLSKLFLHPERRSRGVGRAMLEAAVERARREGFRQIYLCTRDRYAEAVRLYEACGWLRGPDQPPPGPDRLYYLPLTAE
jgi:GNAT superfamily N-acetyltransferase